MDYSTFYAEFTKIGIDPRSSASCPECGQEFSDIHVWLKHRMDVHALHMSQDEEHEFNRMTDAIERSALASLTTPEPPIEGETTIQAQTKHPRIHQCHLCPKTFTRAFALRNHVNAHNDTRPFRCTFCDKAFTRQHDRKVHEEIHSNEKPFQCGGELSTSKERWGCGKRFSRKTHLSRHFRSQDGQKCLQALLEDGAKQAQTDADSREVLGFDSTAAAAVAAGEEETL